MLLACTIALCSARHALAGDMVPFAIPAQLDTSHAIWLSEYDAIEPDGPRLIPRDGRFYRDSDRVRIWGVNLSFGANFPSHEDAPQVAARLAAAGVNSVRLHHMDTSRWPAGIWNAENGRTLSAEALDRLDFFVNELAQRGICVNMNLHVGRAHSEYLGLPETNGQYDKMVGIFTPALIEAQRQYARDLLGHMNPYRNVTYASDPAVAFVEISNEDSLFMWGAEETLRSLPPYYAQILQDRFNAWLQAKYGSDAALRQAWSKGTQPLGENLLRNGSFTLWGNNRDVPADWNLEQHEGARASLSARDGALRVTVDHADETVWHLQVNQRGLHLIEGQYYTLSFEAAANRTRRIDCSAGQAHDPWANLGFSRQVELKGPMQRYSFGFVATATEDNARISFAFSGDATPWTLTNVELRPGGQVAFAPDESIAEETVSLFCNGESKARILDRLVFMAETEKAYFDGMRSYIRDELGCDALVTGTVVFGPLGQYAQSDMDYIDSHAYWQHPRFPGEPWDPENWTIEQVPMTGEPNEMVLWELLAERMPGKPYTVSEYNHPAPLDAQAECVPMIASFAGGLDWDGVWLYTYSHSSDQWDRERLNSYFDIDTNPAKWGFMRAGAALFRQSFGEPPVEPQRSLGDSVELAQLQLRHKRDMLGVRTEALSPQESPRGNLIELFVGAFRSRAAANCPDIGLFQGPGRPLYGLTIGQTSTWTGNPREIAEFSHGEIQIDSPEFVALMITSLDAAPRPKLEDSHRILITACGRCENTGTRFSDDRRTVGRNWGHEPVMIEPVEGKILLPPGRWGCHALLSDGSPGQTIPVDYEQGQGILTLAAQYRTMWYLLIRDE